VSRRAARRPRAPGPEGPSRPPAPRRARRARPSRRSASAGARRARSRGRRRRRAVRASSAGWWGPVRPAVHPDPPSTFRVCPVTHDAALEARNARPRRCRSARPVGRAGWPGSRTPAPGPLDAGPLLAAPEGPVHHVRIGRARADAVRSHMRGEFERQLLRERDDRGLRGAAGAEARERHAAGERGDVNDRAALSGEHAGQDRLGDEVRRVEVDVDRSVPDAMFEFEQGLGPCGAGGAGVADEHADRSERGGRLRDGA
jgi:hypothetical protein